MPAKSYPPPFAIRADISACIFFKFCGATAYSYVRVVSMLVASALSVWLLDFVLTARFVAGCVVVFASASMFQRHRLPPPAGGTKAKPAV